MTSAARTIDRSSPRAPRRSLPVPRAWPVRASDLVLLASANGLLIAAMWVRHGGLDQLDSLAGALTAAGQLTALIGTYLVLIQLVLMSRSPWLDQLFGIEGLTSAHRWLGFACVWLIGAHGLLTTVGYAMGDGSSVVDEAWKLVTTFPYVLMSVAGMALLIAVAVSSVRAARSRLSYETWYGIHLYGYLAIALAFAHQLVVGSDFADDPVARVYWIGLYVLAAALVVVFRVGQPIALFVRHRLRVANVVREGPRVVSIYVTGRNLDRLAVRAGQYFLWRFLTRDGWWRAHPFSLSAAPNGRYLRLTIKLLGDYSTELQYIRIGTFVVAEGPYGVLTAARRTRPGVLLVAGGIGITPLRALLEGLPVRPGRLTLLYRARTPDDLVFRDEIDEIARRRGARVHFLVGRHGSAELPHDPFTPQALRRLVPDLADRDVFLCGPTGMMAHVRRSLRSLRVPPAQVHWERFAY